ncbi:uncharacterized protein BXZ73DRAFT_100847 [Epithele typhae]|uniref:uncharacterized protein n=1 Tax=Epithele typhae TaxID=378194 RepID=UPI00200720FD|nr:uncharacterized protein BXZ73DRAFT_100847 [Epithele typhae]KAH9934009.1 hypothetical protein BXZ73DRAFT_100847 [Epithele typhae]
MYGIIVHQLFQYFVKYPKDPLFLKLWVILAFVTETTTIVISMFGSYHYSIVNWTNPEILDERPPTAIVILPVIMTMTPVIVELFFARRVWLLGPRYRPVVVIAFLLLCGFFVPYPTMAVLGFNDPNPAVYFKRIAMVSRIAVPLVEVADLMLTTVLVYVLHKSHSGFRRTDTLIDLLIKYVVTTQSSICVFLTMTMVLAMVSTDTLVSFAAEMFLCKLHVCVFYTTLNVRDKIITFNDITRAPAINMSMTGPLSTGHTMNFGRPSRSEQDFSNTIGSTRIQLKTIVSVGPEGNRSTAPRAGIDTEDVFDEERKAAELNAAE